MGIFDSFAEYSGVTESGFINESEEVLQEEAYLEEMEAAVINEEDPCEALIEANLVNEQNFNRIMSAVAYEEMQYFVENGTEMVYEEGKISRFFSMIKGLLDRAWAKIKSIFDKVMTQITSWISTDKAFVTKYKDKIMKAKGIKYKGYNFNVATLSKGVFEGISGAAKDIMADYGNGTSKMTDGANTTEMLDKIRGGAFGKNKSVTSGDYATELNKYFGTTEDNKKELTYNSTEILGELTSGKSTRAIIKQGYVSAKKSFAQLRNTIKVAEASANSRANNAGDSKPEGSYGFMGTVCTTAISTMNIAQRIHIRALNTYHSQCRAMAAMAVRGETKATGESADLADSDYSFIL